MPNGIYLGPTVFMQWLNLWNPSNPCMHGQKETWTLNDDDDDDDDGVLNRRVGDSTA